MVFEANHDIRVTKPLWLINAYNIAMPRFRKLFVLLGNFVAAWQFGYAIDKAAEVSFYFVLSCFPFLLVVIVLLTWFHRTAGLTTFSHWLTNYMPLTARNTVVTTMQELSKDSGRFFSFGLLLTCWSASTGFLSLMEALTDVYGQKEARSYLKRRGIAMIATFVAAAFLIGCFSLWRFGHLLGDVVYRDFVPVNTTGTIIRFVVTLGLICLAVDLMNYFLPAKRLPWRWFTPGSVLTAFCFVIASALLGLYVKHNADMARIYGTLTGFIVMMLWIYLITISILLGAQANAMSGGYTRS